jgi:hypothetical protein
VKTLDQPNVKAEILRRLNALTPNSTRKWGKMTAHQAICHLTDSLKALTGEREMTYPNSSALQQTFMRWIALYLPITWVQGVKTAPETDQQLQGTPPAEFTQDKAALLESVERIASGQVRWIAVHPILGTMTEREWQRFEYLHFDHHLRQFGV